MYGKLSLGKLKFAAQICPGSGRDVYSTERSLQIQTGSVRRNVN
jgi:hypothetical protein